MVNLKYSIAFTATIIMSFPLLADISVNATEVSINRTVTDSPASPDAEFYADKQSDVVTASQKEKATATNQQTEVIAIRQEDTAGTKELTIREAVLAPNIRPKYNQRYAWKEGEGAELVKTDKTASAKNMTTEADNSKTQKPKIESRRTEGISCIYCNGEPVIRSESPEIIYGETVSRNEFGIEHGIFLSPSGKKFAFYRKDESNVGTFPLLDISTRTGSLKTIKYPMAGMASERVSLGIYDLETKDTVYMRVTDFDPERYLTCVTWSPDERHIYISVLDRSQKNMHLNIYNASDGSFVKTVLSETNEKYVEPLDPLWFIEDSPKVDDNKKTKAHNSGAIRSEQSQSLQPQKFLYRTANRDGYRNIYLCDTDGNIKRLTKTEADVDYVAHDSKWLYYYSSEVSPMERHLFRVNIRSGKTKRLTTETGWHSVTMSPDRSKFLDRWSNLTTPPVIQCCNSDGSGSPEVLYRCEDPVKDYSFCEIDLGTIPSADGKYSNGYRLIKPRDIDESGNTKYPVIVYVYGGPHSQLVNNSWLGMLRFWEIYMAQKGYIVYVQDNRGTQHHGLEYEQAIWRQCGKVEMEDQMVGVNMLKSLAYVDKDRIGVHGWSYGGFMTISLMTHYPETFKVGVAGGPVIDWKWYEVMYGERYMDHPDVNAEGYAGTSLINQVENLKGRLLICQGAIDNTVVWQHSLSFIQECIDRNVRVDYFPYPKAEHNVIGENRVHLMDKVTLYFEDYL